MSCTVPTEATLSEIAADVAREMVVRAQRDDFSVESDPEIAVCLREVRDNCSEPRVGSTPSLCQSVGTRVVPDASLAGISRMHVIARVRHGRAWLWSGRKEEPSEHDS
jgi:hypothetical protein